MDVQKYRQISKIKYKDVEQEILDVLRNNDIDENNYFSYEIAISTLALFYKNINDEIEKIISEKFSDKYEYTMLYLNTINKQFIQFIQELAKSVEEDVLKAIVLFSQPFNNKNVDDESTIDSISNLTIRLLDIKNTDTVLDLGSGYNSFLLQTAIQTPCNQLFGVEIDKKKIIIANIRSVVLGVDIDVQKGNAVSQDYSIKANKVFSNLPLILNLGDTTEALKENKKLKKYFENVSKHTAKYWINSIAAYLNMNNKGKAVSVIANSGLWKGGKDSKLREDLINEGIIEGVIQLPERLLSGIGISVALLILSENNERIRFVDASNIYTRGRRQNTLEKEDINKIINAYYKDTEISRWVTTEEISKQEYILEPERYFDSKLKFENGLLLAELCISIKRGTMIKATELDEMINTNPTQYHYLMLQNINEGIIDSKLPYLKKIDDKLKKYCINDKNLIISKTSPFKIATVNVKEGEQILANGNLYILDLDETKINPVFVEAFLQSKAGKKQLYKFAKGSAVKSISIRDLTTIRIPDLSKEEQNTIAEEYSRLLDQQKKIRQQVEIIRDRKNNIFEKIK